MEINRNFFYFVIIFKKNNFEIKKRQLKYSLFALIVIYIRLIENFILILVKQINKFWLIFSIIIIRNRLLLFGFVI
jgi:hypothetical protein